MKPGTRISLVILALLTTLAPSGAEPLGREDVLTWRGDGFYLEGQRFAGIGWNKFDLYWALWHEALDGGALTETNAAVRKQDATLRELRSMGFRTIRFFASPYGRGRTFFEDPELRSVHFEALDKAIALCARNDIRAVVSLGCGSFSDRRHRFNEQGGIRGRILGEEHPRELIADPESESRAALYDYLETAIPRYRNSRAVLMWEIGNELTNMADLQPGSKVYHGARMPTHAELATFYDDVARKIKALDRLRMVVNGGSKLRPSAWNQYTNDSWKKDTYEEHVRAWELVCGEPAIDVIDVHYYAIPHGGVELADRILTLNDYVRIMEDELWKPVVIGEYGPLPVSREKKPDVHEAVDWFESYREKEIAAQWFRRAADDLVDSGVQLAWWWAYGSDRAMDKGDPGRFDVSLERDPELVRIVAEANRRMREMYER
ncbi:cellulase family glycosylhydrolase [Kiritimatiella glycovorans]|uniref:mannan endo-1,4-beta-mannosidase n=1 Tax=Kiritimatiella glycovorans TaxID=1307763 RepID=A0A0G3EBL4_9BACT|nr:cellulase family glycosylhydrolase [Kiritimatiella glycovorans]AKJ63841.1 hypothetical protein L21SP4_00570 [Kiritimatiella glycovorans]